MPISAVDLKNAIVKVQIATVDAVLQRALGDRAARIPIDLMPDEIEERKYVAYHDDTMPTDVTMPEADELEHDQYHKFIAARVSLPVGGESKHGKVVKRDDDGMLIGVAHLIVWRSQLAEMLRDLGYRSCIADYDIWMRPNTKPNGYKY
jgi:hypothetical protein